MPRSRGEPCSKERAGVSQGGIRSFQATGITREAMHHALPDIDGGVSSGGDGALDVAQGVVPQDLVIPNMYTQGRQADEAPE
jgi:hypothetical protein